jgi:hypothetical protein
MCQTNCTAPICHDPATIKNGAQLGRLTVHGKIVTDEDIDMTTKSFVLQLSDQAGHVLFRNSLEPGAIDGLPAVGRFKFRSRTAKRSGGLQVIRTKKLVGGYRVTMKAYGDLSAATEHMVTETLIRSMYAYWRKVMAV